MTRAGVQTTWGERIALVALGLLGSLVLVEIVLQLGASYVRSTGNDRRAAPNGGARSVLCAGDSNTYGIRVRREDAYPAVLERLWNGQAARADVQVLNFGVPGMNSSKLRNNFRVLLASERPAIALVLVGANDIWTEPAPVDDQGELTLGQLLWERSRVFRLLYMLERAIRGIDPASGPTVERIEPRGAARAEPERGGEISPPGEDGQIDLMWTGKSKSLQRGWRRALQRNLNAMHEFAAESGTRLVLLTYPAHVKAYAAANEVIRQTAAADLPLIDLARVFADLCPDAPCPELFFPDGHPTRLGYQLVAAVVWRELDHLEGGTSAPRDTASWEAVLDAEVRRRLTARD